MRHPCTLAGLPNKPHAGRRSFRCHAVFHDASRVGAMAQILGFHHVSLPARDTAVTLQHPAGMLLALHLSPDQAPPRRGLGAAALSFWAASQDDLLLWDNRLTELGIDTQAPARLISAGRWTYSTRQVSVSSCTPPSSSAQTTSSVGQPRLPSPLRGRPGECPPGPRRPGRRKRSPPVFAPEWDAHRGWRAS